MSIKYFSCYKLFSTSATAVGGSSLLSLLLVLGLVLSVEGSGFNSFFHEANEKVNKLLQDDRPCNFLLDFKDAYLSTPGILIKYGYPVERHWVTTPDGYILEMHRVPKYSNGPGKPKPPAVFLMHGVFSSSRDYVINCDKRALAFKLWDNGFDVWMGNLRGNTYSRNHTSLRTNDPKFWDFSIDEVGYYDAPAMIDYLLRRTQLQKVSCVGVSMGNGIGLTMLASRPEYNDKIHIWFALAAATTLRDTKSPIIKLVAPFSRLFERIMKTLRHGEFWTPPVLRILYKYIPHICRTEGEVSNYHGICASFLFLNDGYNPGSIPPEVFGVISGGVPTSTSIKFLAQWLQWIISGQVSYYDEGPWKNLQKYGTVKPKRYAVEEIDVPVVLFWGENDWITTSNDVHKSIQQLLPDRPDESVEDNKYAIGKREYVQVMHPSWNHLDYVYAKDADIYVYNHIIERLNKLYATNSLY